jgi:hypothetical protein
MTATFQPFARAASHFVSALAIFLAGAAISNAAMVIGSIQDVYANPYGGRFNTIQFTPLSCPQAIDTNTIWPVQKTANLTNGVFQVNLVGGIYWAGLIGDSPLNGSFGQTPKTVKILVPPNDTNVWQFNTCANLATNLGTFVWTNQAGSTVVTNINNATGTNVNLSGTFSGTFDNATGANVNLAGTFTGIFNGPQAVFVYTNAITHSNSTLTISAYGTPTAWNISTDDGRTINFGAHDTINLFSATGAFLSIAGQNDTVTLGNAEGGTVVFDSTSTLTVNNQTNTGTTQFNGPAFDLNGNQILGGGYMPNQSGNLDGLYNSTLYNGFVWYNTGTAHFSSFSPMPCMLSSQQIYTNGQVTSISSFATMNTNLLVIFSPGTTACAGNYFWVNAAKVTNTITGHYTNSYTGYFTNYGTGYFIVKTVRNSVNNFDLLSSSGWLYTTIQNNVNNYQNSGYVMQWSAGKAGDGAAPNPYGVFQQQIDFSQPTVAATGLVFTNAAGSRFTVVVNSSTNGFTFTPANY